MVMTRKNTCVASALSKLVPGELTMIAERTDVELSQLGGVVSESRILRSAAVQLLEFCRRLQVRHALGESDPCSSLM